jgi:DNA-binding transcriptional regulator GbsR (MarR family)
MDKITSYAISAENKLYKYEPFARAHDDAYDQFRKNVDKYYDSEIEDNVDDLQKALYELNQQWEVDKLLENDESIAKLQDVAVLTINQIAKARNRCTATIQRPTILCPAIEAVEKLKINK